MQQDALRERGGYLVATASPSDLRLPEHVTGAIIARIRGLSKGSQRVLTLASCVGEIFSLPILATVSSVSEPELLDLLEEGMRQRLLRSEGQVFQFAHPLIRHVFYHEASAARRQRIHSQIAQALEHLYADSLEAHLLEIAPHLLRAGPTAQAEEVMNYARRAGDQAFSVSAWREAAHYYEGALSAAESCGRLSLHDRAEMHYRAGLAYYRNQDMGPCLDHHNKAIEAYRLAGDMRGLAQALMEQTRIPYRTSPYGTQVDVQALENVLQALGEDEPGLRGNITAAISQAYRYGRQTAKAKEMAQRAVEIGQRIKDDRLCAEASFALGMAQAQTLHVRETLESWQNAVAHARRVDDLWLQGQPLTRLPHILTSLGRLDEAEAIAHEAGELISTTQDWGNYSLTLSTLVCLAVARGDFATAERRTHETMRMVSRSRYPWGGSRALFAQACARALCGAWAEADDILDLLVEPGRVFEDSGPIIQAFVGVFRRLLRMQVVGEVDTREPFALNLLQGNEMDSYALAPLCALVELGNLMHAPVMAEQPYKALTLAAERGVLFSNANGWMFLIPRVLGVAATLQQQWDKAATHFQTAIDAATRIGARPELGRTYLDYARTLISRGKRGEHRQAGELVRQASHIFATLQMLPYARQATQLAEALQIQIPSSAQPGAAYPDHLSKQEVDVLVLIAHGRSNQEIADTLLLSPRTVAPQVRNMFNKIGVRSRSAATAYAIEQGLVTQLPRRTKPRAAAGDERQVSEGTSQALRIILVTDMEGSTALIRRWGDAKALELFRIHNTIIRDCLHKYSGSEVTHTGDGLEASFASAIDAVQCAVAIQRAFAMHNQANPDAPIHVRMGLNAGEPLATEGRLFGTAVHTTFRICGRAHPGQILTSNVIRQLAAGTGFVFANRGRIALKGIPGLVQLYEVQWENEGT